MMNAHTRNALLEIHGELGAALIQQAPSDDAIIMAHIQKADRLVLGLLEKEEGQ